MNDDARPDIPADEGQSPADSAPRQRRADARRNLDALLQAALAVFTTEGVDAPVRTIAERAGVGVGTVYRHFPQRSDLIVAVFRHEVDACADAAATLAAAHAPGEALAHWLQCFATFIAAKAGLAAALHSGDPAYQALPDYFDRRLRPALDGLLAQAVAAGAVRPDVDPNDLLHAIANLAHGGARVGRDHVERMVALLADGLRRRSDAPQPAETPTNAR